MEKVPANQRKSLTPDNQGLGIACYIRVMTNGTHKADIPATRFLGLDFHPMRTNEAARFIAGMASRHELFWYVVTPNVDHIVRLEREPDLRPLYDDAGLVLNDSRILELLARRDGLEFTPSPGADVVAALFEREVLSAEPVCIIGCSEDDIATLRERFNMADIRWYDAPMGLRKNPLAIEQAAEFMAQNNARFHFLCVGAPQQEMIAQAALRRGDVRGVGVCCGASLDFLTGKTSRAPGWMQRARLEWLHRLASEPGRLGKRYLVEGPAILSIWLKHREARLDRTQAS